MLWKDQNYGSKRKMSLCLKFVLYFYIFCLNTLNTAHGSIVSHEILKSMQNDRNLFIMQTQALVLVFERVDCYTKAISKKLA